ncbi:hypothetical protein BSZ36_16925, partial [Rubricoccus marinus]
VDLCRLLGQPLALALQKGDRVEVGRVERGADLRQRRPEGAERADLLHALDLPRAVAAVPGVGAREIERVQQICSLRALGTPLAEIGAALDAPDFDPVALLERQRQRLTEEAAQIDALR